MKKEGTIVITTELQDRVEKSLRGAAKELGMEIEPFCVVAHLVIQDLFEHSKMKVTNLSPGEL